MVTQGSNLFDSRSNCEPAQSAWESISGEPQLGPSVDAHLLRRVLKPSGVGRLGPSFFWPVAARVEGELVRKALNDNPVAQIAVLGVLALIVGFLLLTRVSGTTAAARADSATSDHDSGAACHAGDATDAATSSEPSGRRRIRQGTAPRRARGRPCRRPAGRAPRPAGSWPGPGFPRPW